MMLDYQEPSLPSLLELWQVWRRRFFANQWMVLGVAASLCLHAAILVIGGGSASPSKDEMGAGSRLMVRLQPSQPAVRTPTAAPPKKRILATEQRPSPAQINIPKQMPVPPTPVDVGSSSTQTGTASHLTVASFAMPSQSLFNWEALSAVDTRFYLASELDEGAQTLDNLNPVYPIDAYQKNIGGRVVVDVYISEFGWVEKVVLVIEEPQGYFFADAVMLQLEDAYFTPAIKNGRHVKSIKKIYYTFDERAAQLFDQGGY